MGQVASFMDGLHLTYPELMDEVPYRNLLLMQRDKAHVVYGTLVKHVSAKERLAQMKKKNK